MIRNLAEMEKGFKKLEFPLNMPIEVCNYCNLNCIMCCNDTLKRKRGYMDIALYRKIIDEIAEKSPNTRIWLDFFGEALLVRYKLYYMIDYAKKKGLKNININTNGTLMDEEMGEMLLDSGIDFISIDVDGYSKEVYENVRRGGNRDVLYHNILNLVKRKKEKNLKKPYIEIKIIEMPENKHEVQKVVDFWKDKGVGIGVRVLDNWTGNLKGVTPQINQERIACGNAIGQLAITWDGKAAACGWDCEAENVFGDVSKESISDIWKRKQEFIDLHMEHKFEQLPDKCKQCTTWGLVGSEEHYLDNGEKYIRSYEFDESILPK
jgi:radical SAM protein with 4Fe4S-binding SPASM domain